MSNRWRPFKLKYTYVCKVCAWELHFICISLTLLRLASQEHRLHVSPGAQAARQPRSTGCTSAQEHRLHVIPGTQAARHPRNTGCTSSQEHRLHVSPGTQAACHPRNTGCTSAQEHRLHVSPGTQAARQPWNTGCTSAQAARPSMWGNGASPPSPGPSPGWREKPESHWLLLLLFLTSRTIM